MTSEVEVQTFQIIQLAGQPHTIYQNSVFLGGQRNLAVALQNLINIGMMLFDCSQLLKQLCISRDIAI